MASGSVPLSSSGSESMYIDSDSNDYGDMENDNGLDSSINLQLGRFVVKESFSNE